MLSALQSKKCRTLSTRAQELRTLHLWASFAEPGASGLQTRSSARRKHHTHEGMRTHQRHHSKLSQNRFFFFFFILSKPSILLSEQTFTQAYPGKISFITIIFRLYLALSHSFSYCFCCFLGSISGYYPSYMCIWLYT